MSGCFRFGDFELDLNAYTLRRAGERVRLEKIPMDVLILLVQAAGALVRRNEMQVALWSLNVFVEHDAAINTAVRKVRQALDDDAEKPRYVETVVGKGYRFIAPVEHRMPGSRHRGVDVTAAQPSSARWRRPFPSFCVTRGKQEFVLEVGRNLLGRDTGARVYIDHASVSRRHACISIRSDAAILEDLKSRNGTFLNGRRIDAPIEIGHGAVIGLGPIALTFIALSAPASTRSVAMAEDEDPRASKGRKTLRKR